VLIILIGLALNALPFPNLGTLRYCGVMQRIGLCYLLSALVLLYLRPRGVALFALASVVGYWLLLTKVPVPGFGYPGVNVPILDPQGNLASYLDRLLIPKAHRYHFSFYDPEGILSTLPAVATTCLGMLTGTWIKRPDVTVSRKLVAMAGASLVLVAAGVGWSYFLPFNKRLWTSSYVLLTGGVSLGLLAFFQWALDYKRLFRGQVEPFLAFGVNALTAYVLSEVLGIVLGSIRLASGRTAQQFLCELIPAWLGPAPFRSLIWSILFVFICWLPVVYLRRRAIVVKL
jgi:predicted acyltransferase